MTAMRQHDAHVTAYEAAVGSLYGCDPEDWTPDEARLLETVPAEHRAAAVRYL